MPSNKFILPPTSFWETGFEWARWTVLGSGRNTASPGTRDPPLGICIVLRCEPCVFLALSSSGKDLSSQGGTVRRRKLFWPLLKHWWLWQRTLTVFEVKRLTESIRPKTIQLQVQTARWSRGSLSLYGLFAYVRVSQRVWHDRKFIKTQISWFSWQNTMELSLSTWMLINMLHVDDS